MTAMDYRQYDNALGRFNSIDALAELGYSITPYRFAFNNPNYFMDPSGLREDGWVNTGDEVFWDKNVNNQDDVNRIYKGKGYEFNAIGTEVIDSNNNTRILEDKGIASFKIEEVVVKGNAKQKSSSSFGWMTIWGIDRSGWTSGWKGTTTHSLESSDFIAPQLSRSLMNKTTGIWEWVLSLFKNATDTYQQATTLQEAVKKNGNISTMEVQNTEPIVTSSIKVVTYTYHVNDSTVTQSTNVVNFKGKASNVKRQIDSIKNKNNARNDDKSAWLRSWGKK